MDSKSLRSTPLGPDFGRTNAPTTGPHSGMLTCTVPRSRSLQPLSAGSGTRRRKCREVVDSVYSFPYQRIVVIGTTSSGKSTLAARLAAKFDMAFIELDALHWEPNWQEAPLEVFRARVQKAIQAERWAVAGNYQIARDLVWPKAQAVIWLDYALLRIFWQLTRRTFARWWTQELLWGTNRERLWTHFKLWSKDSLFHWLFSTYARRKREYPLLLSQPEHQHLKLIRFKHPRETEEWLQSL